MSTKKHENKEFIEGLILRELSYYDNIEQEILFSLVLNRYEELKKVELKREIIFNNILSLIKKGEMEVYVPPPEKEEKEIDQYHPGGSSIDVSQVTPLFNSSFFLSTTSISYKITDKGLDRLLKKDETEKEKAKKELKKVDMPTLKDEITELRLNLEKQIEKNRSYERTIRENKNKIAAKFKAVKKIENDVNNIRKKLNETQSQFFGKTIQIFSIFVAIFGFIIVGFTQIPHVVSVEKEWLQNLGNASAVFIPVVLCIIILLLFVSWIVKKTVWN